MILAGGIVFVIFQAFFIPHLLFISTRAPIISWLTNCTDEKGMKIKKSTYFMCYFNKFYDVSVIVLTY